MNKKIFLFINFNKLLTAACRWSSVSPNSTTNVSSSSSRTAGNGGGAAANSLCLNKRWILVEF